MKKLLSLAILIAAFSTVLSQSVQSPEEYLGYELGTRFTRHHKVVEYFQYVADQVPTITLHQYGETYEHRPLIYVTIASQENHARLEDIRQKNLANAGIGSGSNLAEDIAIVWLSYNVHGNESVSMEASMQTLFELADPSNSRTKNWLKNTVVIMDPCINPDGRDRYANFYNQYGNIPPNPDPASKEHNEPWPGGRGNHYLYDLNRDWAWQKQIESQSRIPVYNQWLPHVHVDFHEQGVNSPYYFAPAAKPYHEYITSWQKDFQVTIGKNNAKYFDENGWLYFTKERFDLLYPSYGDTYPTYNGAIGMTYEQGGSGRAGLTVTTELGDELTLKDRIAHHHSNGLSTIEVTSQNAEKVVNEFRNYFSEAPGKSVYKSYLIKSGTDRDKLQAFLKLMDSHNIQYGRPAVSRKPVSGFHYASGSNKMVSASGNDVVISVNQPKATLLSILLEPATKLEDSITYDITAWSLPYAMGLDAYALKQSIQVEGDYKAPPASYTEPEDASYAYVSPWRSFQDAKYLAYLQKNGIKVRAAAYPFTVEGKQFPRGSLIITLRNNEELGEDFHRIVKMGAEEFDRELATTSTGFVDSGYDFGSGNVNYLEAPRIAIVGGSQTRSTSFGQVWYYFEQEIEYPVSVLDTDYLNRVDLDEYDVIILPSGFYRFQDNMLEEMSDWVSSGGRIIAMDGALNAFADKDGFGLKQYASEEEKKKAEKENEDKPLRRYEDRERESMKDNIPGAIYQIQLDDSHPLAFGYSKEYFTLKIGSRRYAYLERGWNVGVLKEGAKPVNGFAGSRANRGLSESLVFGVYNKGGGEMIYLADNPLFRSFWENGKLLFTNAVFMVGQ